MEENVTKLFSMKAGDVAAPSIGFFHFTKISEGSSFCVISLKEIIVVEVRVEVVEVFFFFVKKSRHSKISRVRFDLVNQNIFSLKKKNITPPPHPQKKVIRKKEKSENSSNSLDVFITCF